MTFALAPSAPRTGTRGMVNAADQMAAVAGVGMLERGGSAADAAVAAAAVMAVTSPHLCGMGGDLLAMVSAPGGNGGGDGSNADPVALLSVGRAGSGVDAAAMRAEGHSVMPLRGDARTAPVPGAVDGWLALHERYGRLSLDTVFAPAIELAEEGFAASILLALASHLVADVPGAEELCPGGRPLEIHQRVRVPGVGRALRAVADGGRDGFYGGEFGQQLLALGGGIYAPEDLDDSAADWCDPLRLRVWGHDLWTVPPPSQAYLTLASAWVAERVGLGTDPTDPQWAHLVTEACRAAGFDRPGVLYDGADGPGLLSEERLEAVAARIRPDQAAAPDVTAAGANDESGIVGDGDTTHLCAIDAEGLGISLTQSNALGFGSHLVAGTTGIFVHNRGVGFSLEDGHPAELAPRRRPPHTLSPMLATNPDGSLSHLAGAMGGDSQTQILMQLMARMLHSHQDPATALAGARLALDAPSAGPFRLWWGADLHLNVEAHAPAPWMTALTDRGHEVHAISAFDPSSVGCAQIIAVVPEHDGVARHYLGAADPRSPEGGTIGR